MKPFRYLIPLFSILLLANGAMAQTEKNVRCDRLAMIWGDTLQVNIKKVSKGVVYYSLVGERMRTKTQIDNLTAIMHKDGRVEKFDNPMITKKIGEGASKIKVTFTEDDVQVYKLLADVEGRYYGATRFDYTNAYLQRMAIENLKEVSYKNDPRVKVILIEKVNITRGYGEAPSAVVNGKAYFR